MGKRYHPEELKEQGALTQNVLLVSWAISGLLSFKRPCWLRKQLHVLVTSIQMVMSRSARMNPECLWDVCGLACGRENLSNHICV